MVNIDNLLEIGYKILKTDEIIKATEYSIDAKEVEKIMQDVKAQLINDLIKEYKIPGKPNAKPMTMDDFMNGFSKIFLTEQLKKPTVAKKTTVRK